MRIDSSVTSISWIPSEAVAGMTKGVFEVGFSHYDDAPPDDIGADIPATLEALRAADRLAVRQPPGGVRRVRRRRLGRRRRLPRRRVDRFDDGPARQAVLGRCRQPARPAARPRDR